MQHGWRRMRGPGDFTRCDKTAVARPAGSAGRAWHARPYEQAQGTGLPGGAHLVDALDLAGRNLSFTSQSYAG